MTFLQHSTKSHSSLTLCVVEVESELNPRSALFSSSRIESWEGSLFIKCLKMMKRKCILYFLGHTDYSFKKTSNSNLLGVIEKLHYRNRQCTIEKIITSVLNIKFHWTKMDVNTNRIKSDTTIIDRNKCTG